MRSHFFFVLQAAILLSSHGQRALSPGRVVTIDTAEHQHVLAVVLKVDGSSQSRASSQLQSAPGSQDKKLTVLVICDVDQASSGMHSEQLAWALWLLFNLYLTP